MLVIQQVILQAIISGQRAKHAAARQCIYANAQFLKALVDAAQEDGPEQGLTAITQDNNGLLTQRTSPHDVDKVR